MRNKRFNLSCATVVALAASLVSAAEPEKASSPAPAPTTDRIGFPKGYQDNFQVLRTVVRAEKQQVVTVYGNTQAASVTNAAQLPYPYGSVIVMETSNARKDAQGKPITDDKGRLVRGEVAGLHVMRREKDFGAAYLQNRSGEWEYVEYRPDGTYITPPAKSASCSACHVKAGPQKDYVYKARLAASE